MNVLQAIAAVLLIAACLAIIILVAMQEGGQGLDSVMGGSSSDTFLSTGGNKGLPAYRLAKYKKICAIVFFVLTIAVGLVSILF